VSRPVQNARSTALPIGLAGRSGRPARIAACALLSAIALAPAFAPSTVRAEGEHGTPHATGGASYAVARWTIDGGGGRSSGGTYMVSGTIAQPDADPLQPSTGGSYAITGGFWPGMVQGAAGTDLFADGFEPR
jgi:hypothetical protein